MSSKDTTSDQEPPPTEPTSGLPLPYELLLSCLALVSRFHYPVLSLVSRTFRSITSSPELYQTRSLLNRTEKCLYVCLQFPTEPYLRWFTLRRNKTSSSSSSSGNNILAQVQIRNSPPVKWSDLVAVGHKLYAINKEDDDVTCSSNVFFLDCRTHTWVETPSLRLAHTVQELNGVMYLAGSYEDVDSLKCVEVFNTETQTWKPVVPLDKRISTAGDYLQGKAYKKVVDSAESSGRSVFLVKLNDFTKELVEFGTSCLIEKIFYCYGSNGEFLWSSNGAQVDGWKKVQGLEELSKSARYSNVNLVDYGGKMMVFWDEYVVPASGGYKEKVIWCAEVSLEMRSGEEVWGTVEWFDAVLTVPKSYKFVYAITATV